MNNTLELVFILDKSGSMQPLADDTIGGFNSNIEKHKDDDCNVLVTTVLFDTRVRAIHDRLPIAEVPPMTRETYDPYGSTALYDAVGRTIRRIENIHGYLRPEDVPEAVLFIIITDGRENASRFFSGDRVRAMVEQKKADGWDFVFIGAGIDAYAGAEDIGISRGAARRVARSKEGMDYTVYAMRKVMDYGVGKARRDEEMDLYGDVEAYMADKLEDKDPSR